jgi:CRISPR-associated endonuclease Cas2
VKTKFKGIKTATEYRRGELAKDILRLVGSGVLIGSVIVAPKMIQVIDYFNPRGREERKRIWRAIKYLEQQNQLSLEEKGEVQYLTLTKHGRIKFDENAIWEMTAPRPSRWDKKWRLVMFDIPVQRGRVRVVFREKLKDLGFRQYQNSVFIYPHKCHEEVLAVARWFEVEPYMRYVVATEIHDMRRFVKEFDLL